jgi:hypothetical protein
VGFEPTIPVLERAKAVGIRYTDRVAPSIRKKLALTSLASGGRSVGKVRLRTEAMEFFFLLGGRKHIVCVIKIGLLII